MKDRKNIEVLIKNKEIRDGKKSQDLLSSSRFNSEKYQKDLLGDSRSDDEDLLRRSRKKNTNIKKHKSNANPSDLHCEVSIKEKIEQALNSSKKRKEKKLSGKVTVLKIQELWNDSVKTEFKDFPHLNWTKKEYGMVKHFLTSGAFSEISEYKEFFEFVCTQWWVIKGQHFKNLNKVLLDKGSSAIDVPEVPMIGFVMVYKKNILNAYAKNKSLLLSPKDRQLQNFQRQGYTIEQAEEKMKEKEMAKQQANKRKELAEAPKIQKQKSLQISAKPKAAIQEPLHNPKTVEEFVVPVFLTDGTIPTCEDPESLELRSWVLAIAKAHEKNAQKVFEDAVMFGTDYVLQSGMFLRKAGTSLTSKGLK